VTAQLVSVNARCQCKRYPGLPCESAITQEDLLCDGCRAVNADTSLACAVFWVDDIVIKGHMAMAMPSFTLNGLLP